MKKSKLLIIYLFLIIYMSISWHDCVLATSVFNFSFSHLDTIDTSSLELPEIYSKRAIVYERNSGIVLFEKNIDEQCPMASTTKIMTAIVVLENANLEDVVTISKKAASTGGSTLGLHTSDKITVHDLLYGLLLRSGNDAAIALAEYVGGDVNSFLVLMNLKAISLGLINTRFESPHGLDSASHYTTAYELAIITDYALNNDTFLSIVSSQSYTIHINNYAKSLNNTNELIDYRSVYGVKTGFTSKAGRCLVTAAKNLDGLDIIVIVLGADTKKIRTSDSKKLIDFALDNFSLIDLSDYSKGEYLKLLNTYSKTINIKKSTVSKIKVEISDLKYDKYPVVSTANKNITSSVKSNTSLVAPIKKGTILSTINFYIDDKYVCFSTISVASAIEANKPIYYFLYFIKIFKDTVLF